MKKSEYKCALCGARFNSFSSAFILYHLCTGDIFSRCAIKEEHLNNKKCKKCGKKLFVNKQRTYCSRMCAGTNNKLTK